MPIIFCPTLPCESPFCVAHLRMTQAVVHRVCVSGTPRVPPPPPKSPSRLYSRPTGALCYLGAVRCRRLREGSSAIFSPAAWRARPPLPRGRGAGCAGMRREDTRLRAQPHARCRASARGRMRKAGDNWRQPLARRRCLPRAGRGRWAEGGREGIAGEGGRGDGGPAARGRVAAEGVLDGGVHGLVPGRQREGEGGSEVATMTQTRMDGRRDRRGKEGCRRCSTGRRYRAGRQRPFDRGAASQPAGRSVGRSECRMQACSARSILLRRIQRTRRPGSCQTQTDTRRGCDSAADVSAPMPPAGRTQSGNVDASGQLRGSNG